MMASLDEIQAALKEHSTLKHHIFYNGALSNHTSHAIFALWKIGATMQRIQQFVEHYVSKTEDPNAFMLGKDDEDIGAEAARTGEKMAIDKLKGSRQGFYIAYAYFETLLAKKYDGSLQKLIEAEFPAYMCAMFVSLTHGLIHTGYGLAAQSPRIVCEGLAYLHIEFINVGKHYEESYISIGKGAHDIMSVLSEVGKCEELMSYTAEKSELPPWAETLTGGQRKMGVLFQNRFDDISRFAHSIKFPDHLNPGLDMKTKEVTAIGNWLLDCAIIVYTTAARKNDFVLLHGITAAWSLKQILPALKCNNDVLKAVEMFICLLIAAYVIRSCPPLDTDILNNDSACSPLTWEEIKSKALDGGHKDEHIYKLIQVCCEHMLTTEEKNCMHRIYQLAAWDAVSRPLDMAP